MPVRYAPDVKAARLEATARKLDGGQLVLLSEGRRPLVTLGLLGVVVEGDELVLETPIEARALARGRPRLAELRQSGGALAADGLEVGAEITLDPPDVVEGQTVRVLSARIRHG